MAHGSWPRGAGLAPGPGAAQGPAPDLGASPRAPGPGRSPLAMSHEPEAMNYEPLINDLLMNDSRIWYTYKEFIIRLMSQRPPLSQTSIPILIPASLAHGDSLTN